MVSTWFPLLIKTNYKMTHNLLLTQYDYYCTLFINGQIPWSLFEAIEKEYNRKKELFEICLN